MTYRFSYRLLVWCTLIIGSIFINGAVVEGMRAMYNISIATFLTYVCSFFFFVALIVISTETIVWHNKKEFILPFLLGFLVAYWIGMVVKNITMIDRPYLIYNLNVLIPEQGFSFPSLHTLTAFSLLPLVWWKNRRIAFFWFAFSLLIAFARVYLGVHSLSDVIMGAFIGYEVSSFFLSMEYKYAIFSQFNRLLFTTLEIRRQLFHTLFGCFIVFLVKIYLLTVDILFIMLCVIVVFIFLLKYHQFPRWMYKTLSFFEREKHLRRFPARGIFYFLVGVFLSLLLFPEHIALASIMILTFGDSVTNIVGRYFGKMKIPYSKKKHWEGTLFGIFFGLIGASFFVPLHKAFLGAMIAMFIETFDLRIGNFEIDDNMLIPLVAGYVML